MVTEHSADLPFPYISGGADLNPPFSLLDVIGEPVREKRLQIHEDQ